MRNKINWKELRENFFNECTTETPREQEMKKVALAPHDLFEWFKKEIQEYLIEEKKAHIPQTAIDSDVCVICCKKVKDH